MRIKIAKERVALLLINPTVLNLLRESAKLYTMHYSMMIEGNQLKPDEILFSFKDSYLIESEMSVR